MTCLAYAKAQEYTGQVTRYQNYTVMYNWSLCIKPCITARTFLSAPTAIFPIWNCRLWNKMNMLRKGFWLKFANLLRIDPWPSHRAGHLFPVTWAYTGRPAKHGRDLSSFRYCARVHWTNHFFQDTRKHDHV